MVRSQAAPVRGATGRTWERRPAERRAELLDAAEHLFAGRGVADVTVADIAAAAGVSKGSFYGYFASKEELVAALNERFGNELFAVLDEALGALVSSGGAAGSGGRRLTRSRLREILEVSVAQMVHALVARRDLIEAWARDPSTAGRSLEWTPRFVDRLAPWVAGVSGASGLITCSDPTATSLLVAHGIFGTFMQAVIQQQPIDEGALVRSAQEVATRAFGLA